MKIINVEYMTNGNYIENYDKPYVIDDESGVCVKATFPQGENGSVRAYIGGSGSGDVVDCGTVSGSSRTAQVVLTDDNLACGFVTIGFEINTGSMSIRYRPLKLKVNPFIDITGSNPHGYTVTVSVGSVSSLPSGSEPTVENAGTSKDVILNFGIPKGEKGDKGDKGDMPEVVDNLTSTDTTAALSANQGKVLDGKKVDKVDGKGLSANDFTDAHKAVADCMSINDLDRITISKQINAADNILSLGQIAAHNDVYSLKDGTHALSNKADKFEIVTSTTGNMLLLPNRHEVQLLSSPSASLTVTIPGTITTDYEAAFAFKSGETATMLTYSATPITWRGADCDSNGDFTPQKNTCYEISVKCLGFDADNAPVVVARVGAF